MASTLWPTPTAGNKSKLIPDWGHTDPTAILSHPPGQAYLVLGSLCVTQRPCCPRLLQGGSVGGKPVRRGWNRIAPFKHWCCSPTAPSVKQGDENRSYFVGLF